MSSLDAMTAKELLHERVEALSEDEAAETLRFLSQRSSDARVPLDEAPPDDERTTPEEEAAVTESWEQIARGETVSLEEVITKYQ